MRTVRQSVRKRTLHLCDAGEAPALQLRLKMNAMSAFWIFGIILNVTLTALAIWWVVKQMRRRDDKRDK